MAPLAVSAVKFRKRATTPESVPKQGMPYGCVKAFKVPHFAEFGWNRGVAYFTPMQSLYWGGVFVLYT